MEKSNEEKIKEEIFILEETNFFGTKASYEIIIGKLNSFEKKCQTYCNIQSKDIEDLLKNQKTLSGKELRLNKHKIRIKKYQLKIATEMMFKGIYARIRNSRHHPLAFRGSGDIVFVSRKKRSQEDGIGLGEALLLLGM